ncbi:MAG TPA: sulfatase-like hydrolase/transferase [Ilumatobacteraceae bacterium]|nr:sulfatase-like hydrolase/transferase [Ilumatobacteraceae bacterium]
MPTRPNVLLITLDQYRGDALSGAGHPVVRTPHLDALAAEGVRLSHHFAQAAPCAPGRAALYTGTYQMTNRVVANGTPLDHRFDNVARFARRAGYRPTLFGYTDQGVDPRTVTDRSDPRLSDYEGFLPGFEIGLDLRGPAELWLAWLAAQGHVFADAERALVTEPERPAELSQSTFLTDHLLDWVRRQDEPWFAHASYLRPHPPYRAAGHWSRAYDPVDMPAPTPAGEQLHGIHRALLADPRSAAPADPAKMARWQAQYFGMCSEVDDQLGRVWAELRQLDQWDDTIVIVTADHGEQLGDQGLIEKAGFFEASYHIIGIVRDPRHPAGAGSVVDDFTENVDILPTIAHLLGEEIPAQCDGHPLTPFLDGERPARWRTAAHWEWDWRDTLPTSAEIDPWRRDRDHCNLATLRTATHAYVQFGNGSWRCYDLAADPTWRTEVTDPAVVLPLAQSMIEWRSTHLDRNLTEFALRDGGVGRWPYSPLEV